MPKKSAALPALYKKSSTGAIQKWCISTSGISIITEWGVVDGKMQKTTETIHFGKNVGKKNETTPEEQAALEAASRWDKKLKSGYVQTIASASSGAVDAVIEGGVFPMLAHVYENNKKHVKFPAFVQPKFDGHRCIAVVNGGKCTLWSRTRKKIESMPHIVKLVEDAARESKIEDIIFDGELYNHDYHDRFEELTSKIRQQQPAEDCELVKYYIYDIVDTTKPFKDRKKLLSSILENGKYEHLYEVDTYNAVDEEELYDLFYSFINNGYEGAMYRDKDALYVNKRSRSLLKVKEFKDSEFTVVGIEEGRGKMEGHAVIICTAVSGETFKVKMAMAQEELRHIYLNSSDYVGKQLTVKYQGLTAKSIPRFPVGVRFREDL